MRAKCIGRESNPGLAESSEILDLEWQRPILPLNHQCYWLKWAVNRCQHNANVDWKRTVFVMSGKGDSKQSGDAFMFSSSIWIEMLTVGKLRSNLEMNSRGDME